MTLITEYPKPSIGGSPVVTFQASYPCLSATICDKPAWTKDANGYLNNYQTDYTYDSSTGLLVETQLPAVTVNGQSVRPTTANSYQKISTANGSVWRLTTQATCIQSQGAVSTVSVTPTTITPSFSCANGAADQVVTTSSYDNNALPTSVTTSGNGLSANTTTTYDMYGDVQTVVGPLGAAFTTKTWYDAARRKLGVVGPAPGNGGSVLNRAQRFSYTHPDGVLTLTEQGTTSGYPDLNQAPAQWSGFTTKTQAAIAYDALDRKSQDTVKDGGGAAYAATQYIYDAASRLQCTAVRMNLAAIPASPTTCALSTVGSYGPDRITYNTYDAANDVVKITTGYATGIQRDEKTVTFTLDGLTHTVADGNGNLSTYVYDGFDRISQLQYPSPTTAGQSSTSDYEGFGYDANNNMTSHRLRDTYSIAFAYDKLNRKTKKTPSHEPANVVSYGYDALGRLLSESFDNNAALNLGFTYDALGRRLTQSGPLGTVTSTWDLGGRRTQLKWADTNYVKYDYDNQNQVIDIEENGATSSPGLLATFTYDDLGDRTGVTRGDGVSTAYVYDPIGRLASLSHSGATNTQAYTQIGFDPAGEMVKFTTSNGAYAWNGAIALTQGYAADGQNKYTSVGSSVYAYDSNANLATLASGGPVFQYDSENRLIGKTGGVTLGDYPDGSLWQTTGGSPVVTTYFQYDGDQIIGEYSYDSVNHVYSLLRRFVPGPGVDEPIVWYEGSTLTNRRWLLGDHQGSVIAWADTSGSIPNANINTYDEYGQPGSGNAGRFQYTGQAWLPELGVYDYRARNYMPSIGRFMQTDPQGYDAGMSLYAYAGNDPVDNDDPTGLDTASPPPEPSVGEVVVTGQDLSGSCVQNSNQNGCVGFNRAYNDYTQIAQLDAPRSSYDTPSNMGEGLNPLRNYLAQKILPSANPKLMQQHLRQHLAEDMKKAKGTPKYYSDGKVESISFPNTDTYHFNDDGTIAYEEYGSGKLFGIYPVPKVRYDGYNGGPDKP